MKKLLFAISPLLLSSIALSETIQCKVISVHDGNTVTCLTAENTQLKVSLWGIDAPELDQRSGEESKQALSDMIFNQQLEVKIYSKDKHDSTQGIVIGREACSCNLPSPTSGGTCLCTYSANQKMIQQGYAWYDPFIDEDLEYQQAERKAKEAKRGLWTDSNLIPPWKWRKLKGIE